MRCRFAPTRRNTDAGTVTSHAGRAGELAAERRHAWDERKPRCCKKPYVWDIEPAMHLGALVPDLVALDEPPARLGILSEWEDRQQETLAGGCPRVEPATNGARLLGREPVVLKGRRGERESFEGARDTSWQPSQAVKRGTVWTLHSCLVQPLAGTGARKSRRSAKAWVNRCRGHTTDEGQASSEFEGARS